MPLHVTDNLQNISNPAIARANLSAAPTMSIIPVSTSTLTLDSSHLYNKIRITTAGGCNITINAGLGVSGVPIIFRRATGAGAISFTLSGVTINNNNVSSIAVEQEFALVAVGANEWDFVGGGGTPTVILDYVQYTALVSAGQTSPTTLYIVTAP